MTDKPQTRVCHIISGLGVGGAERFLLRLIKKMQGHGLQHEVLVLGRKGKLSVEFSQYCPVEHINIPSLTGGLDFVRAILQRKDTDVFHGWLVYGHTATVLAKLISKLRRRQKQKFFWAIRQTLDSQLRVPTRAVLRANKNLSVFADKVIFNSDAAYKQHVKAGFTNDNTVVIPNGFEIPEKVPSKTTVKECRQALGVPKESRVFLVPARWNIDKGHSVLFEALADLFPELSDKTHFVFAGRGVDSSRTKGIIDERFEERMHFLGELSDLTAAFTAADVLILPSRAEAFSNAIGEGMGFGRMAIVTRTGDMPYLVGKTGVIAEPGDVTSLKEVIRSVQLLSDEEIGKKGLEARTRILKNFFLEDVIQKYIAIYKGDV